MNSNIIMFPTKKQTNQVSIISQSVVPQDKPLNAVQKIKQKNDPDLMVKLLHKMQAEDARTGRKGEVWMNRVIISGKVVSEPIVRHVGPNNSTLMCSFVLAVRRPNNSGKVDFPTITTWRGAAEFAQRNLSTGRRVIVHGELRTHDFTGKDGETHKSTEIQADYIEFADNRPR